MQFVTYFFRLLRCTVQTLFLATFLLFGLAQTRLAAQTPLAGSIYVDANSVVRTIPKTLFGTNVQWVWNGDALWNPSCSCPDPTLTRAAKLSKVSLIRYPGGMYADFYHWQNGVGPAASRVPALHSPATGDKSVPYFGTDEALSFADQVGAQLLITVNAGTGTPEEAAAWVSYVNKTSLRVQYWEVGNELYIKDGGVDSKAITIDPATYAQRFLAFASAMRAADPRIKIGAIGGLNQGNYTNVSYPDWDKIVLQTAGSQIDFLSVHNSYAPGWPAPDQDVRTVYGGLFAAPAQIAQNLQGLTNEIATYAPSRANNITVAVTEWGPLFQTDPAGVFVEHTKTLGSALFVADMMKTLIESPSTDIANFHVLNDGSIMGWIGDLHNAFGSTPLWTPEPRFMAFELFSTYFGSKVIKTSAVSPGYNTPAVGAFAAAQNVPYLDAISSLSADGKTLYIMAINKSFDSPIDVNISVAGFQPNAAGSSCVLTGASVDANTGTGPVQLPGQVWAGQATDPVNPNFYAGSTAAVQLKVSAVKGLQPNFNYRFPPLSATSLILHRP